MDETDRPITSFLWLGADVSTRLLQLLTTHPITGRQVHDANLLATMLEHGVGRLLTFNTADFQSFADVITLVPLPAATS